MKETKTYFHTFDAFRFFSFLLVFIPHVPGAGTSVITLLTNSGGTGVSFFFVLSGFLITYILLHEKTTTGKISLKKFFMRRILRIWPLFYAMILFAFLTPYILNLLQLSFSAQGYKPDWLMSLLFLENYKMMITGNYPNVSPLTVMWSLCIEEHFYILWGMILFFIPCKKIPLLIILSIITANILKLIYGFYNIATADLFSNIDYFAFGAIPAYLYIFKNNTLEYLNSLSLKFKFGFALTTLFLVFLLPNIHNTILFNLSPLIFGSLFSLLIIFTLTNKQPILISNTNPVSKLGIYTYGLYLYHTLVINLIFHIQHIFPFKLNLWIFFIFSLICTIMVSMFSYHYFEKPFLKLKIYFT